MPTGTFLSEGVDAHPAHAVLGAARQPGAMSLGLSRERLGRTLRGLSAITIDARRRARLGMARRDTHGDLAAVPAARLALGMVLCLRVGFALRFLQTAGLAQRCTHLAGLDLADPPS